MMDFTSSSLDFKEALSYINNAFIRILSQVGCTLECVELKEDFECKKYLYKVSKMGSKHLFRFRSGKQSLNEELGRCCIFNNFNLRENHIT